MSIITLDDLDVDALLGDAAEMQATVDAALEQLAHRIGLDDLTAAFTDGDKAKAIIGRLGEG
jgi:hypothetical protein